MYAGKIWLIARSSHFLLSSGVPRNNNKSLVVKQTVDKLLINSDDLVLVNPLTLSFFLVGGLIFTSRSISISNFLISALMLQKSSPHLISSESVFARKESRVDK